MNATFSNVVVDTERGFNGAITQPRSQSAFSANLAVPVLAASRWAATTQARDQIEIANLSTADVRTEIAVATAQAYLAIIAQKRQVEVSMRARETALSHLDYARRRLEAGAGTKLNELRAGQEVATDEARLENAQLGVRRAQEALGVLMVANGPVDAAAEPVFAVPEPLRSRRGNRMDGRPAGRAAVHRVRAGGRPRVARQLQGLLPHRHRVVRSPGARAGGGVQLRRAAGASWCRSHSRSSTAASGAA